MDVAQTGTSSCDAAIPKWSTARSRRKLFVHWVSDSDRPPAPRQSVATQPTMRGPPVGAPRLSSNGPTALSRSLVRNTWCSRRRSVKFTVCVITHTSPHLMTTTSEMTYETPFPGMLNSPCPILRHAAVDAAAMLARHHELRQRADRPHRRWRTVVHTTHSRRQSVSTFCCWGCTSPPRRCCVRASFPCCQVGAGR